MTLSSAAAQGSWNTAGAECLSKGSTGVRGPDERSPAAPAARAGLSREEEGTEGAQGWAGLPEDPLHFQSGCTGRTSSSWRGCGASGSRSTGPPVR